MTKAAHVKQALHQSSKLISDFQLIQVLQINALGIRKYHRSVEFENFTLFSSVILLCPGNETLGLLVGKPQG